MPPLEHPWSLFTFVLIGVMAFRAMGSIIGAVANSMQESQIIIQLLYFPMLFLGGATFPIAIMPNWLQIVAQFIPTTYLTTGITAILQGHETIWDNLAPAGALILTAIVGTFLALKLFRWEKEEKMRASAKFWLIAVLAHFIYGMPPLEHPWSLFTFVLIGVMAFRAMGSIIGAVANSMQESQIIIQLLYFPMLFLGGATFPISIMPNWLQIVSQFIPTTYLSLGLNGILGGHETIWQNRGAAGALLLTAIVGTFLAVKLFRWEKEEKMKGSAKAWLVVVMAPFLMAGIWQSYSKDNLQKVRF
jgi:ABC-type multidrug transport system permease subunit